jgi:hypothetical protein
VIPELVPIASVALNAPAEVLPKASPRVAPVSLAEDFEEVKTNANGEIVLPSMDLGHVVASASGLQSWESAKKRGVKLSLKQ